MTIRVVVKGGKPVGGIQRATVKKGQKVAIVVHSDVADEVHVHGYDLHKDVDAGGTVRIVFPATITGVFEAELESRRAPDHRVHGQVTWILAHGIGGIRDLPVPRYVFYYGAAAVLVVSFAALAFLWRKPRARGARETDGRCRPGSSASCSPPR